MSWIAVISDAPILLTTYITLQYFPQLLILENFQPWRDHSFNKVSKQWCVHLMSHLFYYFKNVIFEGKCLFKKIHLSLQYSFQNILLVNEVKRNPCFYSLLSVIFHSINQVLWIHYVPLFQIQSNPYSSWMFDKTAVFLNLERFLLGFSKKDHK